jgi:hypothetical protein
VNLEIEIGVPSCTNAKHPSSSSQSLILSLASISVYVTPSLVRKQQKSPTKSVSDHDS